MLTHVKAEGLRQARPTGARDGLECGPMHILDTEWDLLLLFWWPVLCSPSAAISVHVFRGRPRTVPLPVWPRRPQGRTWLV